MVALDRLFKGMEHLDAVFAPIMILVTYYQTLALLLELPTNWPPILKTVLESLQFLNVNLETTGPECSGDYDAVGKLGLSITLPLLIFGHARRVRGGAVYLAEISSLRRIPTSA